MDGDSTDELLQLKGGFVLDRMSQDLTRCVGGTVYRDSQTFGAATSLVGGSKAAGMWYTHVRRDSLFLFSSRAGNDVFVVRGTDSLPPVGWDGAASNVMVHDLDGDGDLEAVVAVFSRVDAYPRGIYVVDYETGCHLWSFETGPSLTAVRVVDVDGDSLPEILTGSCAHGNGGIANGTSDSFSYVFLLSGAGRARWVTRIGQYSSVVYASLWQSGPERPAQVVAYEVGNEVGGRTADSVFLLDVRDGSITSRDQCGRFTNDGAVGFRADGSARLALAGSDETLRVLGDSLKVESKVWVRGGVRRVLAGRFSGRGPSEWAVLSADGRLILFDSELRMLSQSVNASATVNAGLGLVRCESKDRLLVVDYGGDQSRWLLFDFSPIPPMRQAVPLGVAISLGATMLFGSTAAIVALRYRQTHDMRVVVRGLTGQAGVVEMGNRGQVRHTNQKARELLGGDTLPAGPLVQAVHAALSEPLGAVPKELPVALGGGKTVLARAARVRSGVMLTLEDISAVEYLQRVKAWAPVAQKLAHGIKNPLGTIMGAVEQIETEVNRRGMKAEGGSKEPKARSADETKAEVRRQNEEGRSAEETDQRVKKYIGYVKDEVTRLKKMTDAFMRFTKLNPPALEPKDVNELVRKVVARYGWDLERLENGDSPTKREDARYSPHFPSRSGTVPVFGGQSPLSRGISLELNLDHKLPSVALDEEGMANVLDIVVENAVEAMMGRSQKLETRSEKLEVPGAERILRIRTAVRSLTTKAPRHEGSDGTSTNNTDARTLEPLDPRTQVSIEVTDTGAGIPEKYLDKVFEPYFTHGKQDGTGLGLALAKKIVEDHRGRMEIHSREGEGTTVAIILPAEKEPG